MSMSEYSILSKKISHQLELRNKAKLTGWRHPDVMYSNSMKRSYRRPKFWFQSRKDTWRPTSSDSNFDSTDTFTSWDGSQIGCSTIDNYCESSSSGIVSSDDEPKKVHLTDCECKFDATKRLGVDGDTQQCVDSKQRTSSLVMEIDAKNFKNVTSLSITHNHLTSLDVSPLTSLRELICSHNALSHLALHGALLAHLNAASNGLTKLITRYPPRQLIHIDLSRNYISELPDWLRFCGDLKTMDISRNRLVTLPGWIPLTNIVELSLHHNKLVQVPDSMSLTSSNADESVEQNVDIPPPTPPRAPNLMNPFNPRQLWLMKASGTRPLHQKVDTFLPFPPPPPPPPPPKKNSYRTLSHRTTVLPLSSLSLDDSPPPVPPLPDHIRRSHLARTAKTPAPQQANIGQIEEDHYEECGFGNQLQKSKEEYPLEILLLYHNKLKSLPKKFLDKFPRLRVLNVSNNQLSTLPPLSRHPLTSEIHPTPVKSTKTDTYPSFVFDEIEAFSNDSPLCRLQEFYGSCNGLRDLDFLRGCPKLRVLHASYNELASIPDQLIEELPLLEELAVAGNRLSSLPAGVGSLECLRLLRVNCNPIANLPQLSSLPNIRIIDASHCRLGELKLASIIAPTLSILDVADNETLSVDPRNVNLHRTRGLVSVIDARKDRHCRLNHLSATAKQTLGEGSSCTWATGFAECTGQMDRLMSHQIRLPHFVGSENCAVFGILQECDSPHTSVKSVRASQGPAANLRHLQHLLQEDFQTEENPADALKYTMKNIFRKQLLDGQERCSSFTMIYLSDSNALPSSNKTKKSSSSNGWRISLQACIHGSPAVMLISRNGRPVMVSGEPEDLSKVTLGGDCECCRMLPKIGTLDNTGDTKLNEFSAGQVWKSTKTTTRQRIPDPKSVDMVLDSDCLGIVLASQGLWSVMDPGEVNQICLKTVDPLLCARRLLTLAQSYGQSSSLSITVVGFPLKDVPRAQNSDKSPTKYHQPVTVEGDASEVTSCHSKKILNKEFLSMDTVTGKNVDLPGTEFKDWRSIIESGRERLETQRRNSKRPEMKDNITSGLSTTTINGTIEDSSNKSKRKRTLNNMFGKESALMNLPLPHPYNPSNHERSSPSGQSFSDLSSATATDDTVSDGRKMPLWPGQLGPVTPSGPFAKDLNKVDSGSDSLPINVSGVQRRTTPRLPVTKNAVYTSSLKRGWTSIRSSAESFLSASTMTTKTETGSFDGTSAASSTASNHSVPVFRPFYHFPRPDSIILLNKSHCRESDPNPVPRFQRASSNETNARSSFIARKLKPFNKLVKSSQRSTFKEPRTICSSVFYDTDVTEEELRNAIEQPNAATADEQLSSFEYILAKNARMVYLRDLNNASLRLLQQYKDSDTNARDTDGGARSHRRTNSLHHATSVPNLSDEQFSNPEYKEISNDKEISNRLSDLTINNNNLFQQSLFNRIETRKSGFEKSTARKLQSRFTRFSGRLGSLQRLHCKEHEKKDLPQQKLPSTSFKRYGSLQNMKSYQLKPFTAIHGNLSTRSYNVAQSFHSLDPVLSIKLNGDTGILKPPIPVGNQSCSNILEYLNPSDSEMQERRSVDPSEMESRMTQYWHKSATCF